ncbi:uncharacterized protein F5147DRAFT_659096 [Suillus discolor]|uniref:Uncharacterized protein n=1 Tax=Suillus discolor TaxID=1912936 RepID=A0A9P7ERM9_9AGAM|nr:uncharacterized protein F5147DRAFT_659096 [Suillus discolor]KAG2086886.1 hypothetical protein F5147DRAFT_659096 [Suillus discolor]
MGIFGIVEERRICKYASPVALFTSQAFALGWMDEKINAHRELHGYTPGFLNEGLLSQILKTHQKPGGIPMQFPTCTLLKYVTGAQKQASANLYIAWDIRATFCIGIRTGEPPGVGRSTRTRTRGKPTPAARRSKDPGYNPSRVYPWVIDPPVLSTYVQHTSANADVTRTYVDGTRRRRGVHWAFAHGIRRIGNGVVVVGDGVAGVCASAGANDKDGGANDGKGDADGGVGMKAGGGASAGRTKIGAGDVTRMTLLLLLRVESSIWWTWEGALGAGVGGGADCSVHAGMLGAKMLIVAW